MTTDISGSASLFHHLSLPCDVMTDVDRGLLSRFEQQTAPFSGVQTRRHSYLSATMINKGVKKILTTDPHFDLIPQIRRIPRG